MGTSGERREVCFDTESLLGLTEAKRLCAEEVPSWGSGGSAASSLTLEEGAIGKLEKENAAGTVVHQRLVLDGERGSSGGKGGRRGRSFDGSVDGRLRCRVEGGGSRARLQRMAEA
ncbi:hypothetical protein PIB30_071133 [Stylosanthes scabra]|uniref:Uncharacterized protein n=1 Tax=Stylosanthes scabra TaxID=79078 RepID=A0ABU6ZME1_9FABA|nr:hypothetical protein [Stylosanthes scabra]